MASSTRPTMCCGERSMARQPTTTPGERTSARCSVKLLQVRPMSPNRQHSSCSLSQPSRHFPPVAAKRYPTVASNERRQVWPISNTSGFGCFRPSDRLAGWDLHPLEIADFYGVLGIWNCAGNVPNRLPYLSRGAAHAAELSEASRPPKSISHAAALISNCAVRQHRFCAPASPQLWDDPVAKPNVRASKSPLALVIAAPVPTELL